MSLPSTGYLSITSDLSISYTETWRIRYRYQTASSKSNGTRAFDDIFFMGQKQ